MIQKLMTDFFSFNFASWPVKPKMMHSFITGLSLSFSLLKLSIQFSMKDQKVWTLGQCKKKWGMSSISLQYSQQNYTVMLLAIPRVCSYDQSSQSVLWRECGLMCQRVLTHTQTRAKQKNIRKDNQQMSWG